MTTPLTALERDLLACVERLVMACETSTAELRALETRSTTGIECMLDGLRDCVTLLLRSQTASMSALHGLLSEELSYETLAQHLDESLTQAKAAEQRLKTS